MHSAAQHERGCSAGLRPAPAPGWSNSNGRSRFPVGRRGGSGCGGRCKYIHVSSVAASMRLTPPQPDPPRLRQISAICGRSTPCVDESLTDNEINRGQIRFPTENGSDPMTPRDSRTHPTVTGKLSKVGRCRIAGCPRHGCRGQAPMDGFTASPQSDTAPPNTQTTQSRFGLGFGFGSSCCPGSQQVQRAALPAHPPLRTKTISLISANRHPFATPVPYCGAACAHGRPMLKNARPSLRSIQERHCEGRELGEQQQDVPGHAHGATATAWQ